MTTHSRSLKRWTVALSLSLGALITTMIYLLWQDAQRVHIKQQLASDVSRIRIQRQSFPEISITKKAGLWTIESPCVITANEQRLSPLLGALQPGAGGHQYDASEVDLTATGLQTAMATVFLDEQEYRIGHADVDGNRRYLQQDNTVYFGPEWVLSLVNGGVTALAQLDLFSDGLTQVSFIDGALSEHAFGTFSGQKFTQASNQGGSIQRPELAHDKKNNQTTGPTGVNTGSSELKSNQRGTTEHIQDDIHLNILAASSKRPSLENPETWQNLSAQQIAVWPIDGVPATPTVTLIATSNDGSERRISVHEIDKFTAIRLDNAKCAYILEPDSLAE